MRTKLVALFLVILVLVGCAPQGTADCPTKYKVTIEDTQNVTTPATIYYVARFGIALKQGALAMYLADTCRYIEIAPSVYQSVVIEQIVGQ